MKRKIAILCVSLALYSSVHAQKKKPNILFITTDYQSFEDIPDKNNILDMPTIDRMCREGVMFENHYCTAPICQPSRYTIISGMYPHFTEKWDNSPKWLPGETPVLMEELGKEGYYTAGIGKMHFIPFSRMAGFDRRIIAEGSNPNVGNNDDFGQYLKKTGKSRTDYLKMQSSGDIYGLFDWNMADTLHQDYFIGSRATVFVKDSLPKDRPWFTWVSFVGPHNPWDAPAQYTKPYLEASTKEARYRKGELKEKPFDCTVIKNSYTRATADVFDQYPERFAESVHRIRAAHFGKLTQIDRQLANIIKALEESGELNNTIVIFTADHGSYLGDHGLIHKGWSMERSAKVPFIVWAPGRYLPHRVTGFTSHLDIFPTLMELAGGKAHSKLEGNSIVDVFEGKSEGSDHAVIEIRDNMTYITKDYKVALHHTFGEIEVYDRKADPDELYNMYSSGNYDKIVEEYSQKLYDLNPSFRVQMQKGRERNKGNIHLQNKSNFTFKQGDVVQYEKAPYFGGKAFEANLSIKTTKAADGKQMIWYTQDGGVHGFFVYAEKGVLKVDVLAWRNKKSYSSSSPMRSGVSNVKLVLNAEGKLTMAVNGIVELSENVAWPMPLQDGRPEFYSGTMAVGQPGENLPKSSFTPFAGVISSFNLKFY